MKSSVDLPKLRYLDDYNRYLKQLDEELNEISQVVQQQQKLLASKFTQMKIKASWTFSVTPTDPSAQRALLRRLKTKVDPELSRVVVPNMKKLQSQYNLAEDLYEKFKTVESMETQLNLQFPDRRGEAFKATITALRVMKDKISAQLKIVLGFLNKVAAEHVPVQFAKYVQLVAEMVSEHVIFKDSQSFMYASVTPDGDLCFTDYLMLVDAVNDEGEITPHLYISIQWILSTSPSLTVDLNHEYEAPNKLIGSGEQVDSVESAIKAISTMLSLESFSSALGVVPLALQLKVDPDKFTSEMFSSVRDLISTVSVDQNNIMFKLRKEADSPELVQRIAYRLYKDLKELLVSKKARLKMSIAKEGKTSVIKFNVVLIAEGSELNTYDLEFLRDRFGLDERSLRKVALIINQGAV